MLKLQLRIMKNILNIKALVAIGTKLFLMVALLATVFTCEDDNDEFNLDTEWRLVWSDEFEGTEGQTLDRSKWDFAIGDGCDVPQGCGWGNNELQYYTDRPENVSMDGNGNLAITARAESFGGRAFTSARIRTQGTFEQQYGRFEARIKMPWGPGLWPAFWMLGSTFNEEGWPQCGEIDIMEFLSRDPDQIQCAMHGPGYSGGSPIKKTFALQDGRFDTDFHIFAAEWGESYVNFFVDDVFYFRIVPEDAAGEWVFDDHPFFMILNFTVGGNLVGFPTQQTQFPQTMLVDYVRVYQEAN